MSKANEIAVQFLDTAKQNGWSVSIRNSILCISKQIHNKEEFVKADSEYYGILSLAPRTSPGSVWGTDGGGIGALSAMSGGYFEMKKSGCSKRVLNELKKMI